MCAWTAPVLTLRHPSKTEGLKHHCFIVLSLQQDTESALLQQGVMETIIDALPFHCCQSKLSISFSLVNGYLTGLSRYATFPTTTTTTAANFMHALAQDCFPMCFPYGECMLEMGRGIFTLSQWSSFGSGEDCICWCQAKPTYVAHS